jgi:integrase/recombinase XerD
MTASDLVDSSSFSTDQSLTIVNAPGIVTDDESPSPLREACRSWLLRSQSPDTRSNYQRDVRQFLAFCGMQPTETERLPEIRPHQVAAWRDQLSALGLTNSSIRRKLTVLRSVFSYLQTYGYVGANPAHSDFVTAPAAPRDGKTVGLTPEECRRLLDAPPADTPMGIRDQALLAVLAYTGCRVGEVARLKVGDYQHSGGHRLLQVTGKGGKERRVPIHPEAAERLEAWFDVAGIRDQLPGPLLRPAKCSRDTGRSGFALRPMTRRAIQALVKGYAGELRLDPHVTVHSLRVTALTTARERGSDIIDLQDFAGHADPRTTLTYIRSRDRLSKSPAYLIRYE